MRPLYSWLLGVYIVAHLTSAAVQEFCAFMLLLLFLARVHLDKKNHGSEYLKKKLTLGIDGPLLAFGFWALAGTIYIFRDFGEFQQTLRDIRWIVVIYISTYMMRTYFTTQIEKHFRAAMVTAVIVGAYGLLQMFYPIDIVRGTTAHLGAYGDFHRATGFFKIPLTYAYAIGTVGLFGVARLIMRSSSKSQLWAWAGSLAAIVGVVASITRGAWIALFAAFFFALFSMKKKAALLTSGVMAVALVTLLMIPSFQHRAKSIFDFSANGSNSERLYVWRANWAMLLDHPLTGVGHERSKQNVLAYYDKLGIDSDFRYHAHNDILHTLSGTGFPGGLFYIWFCAFFIWTAYRLFRDSDEPIIRELALGAFLAQIYFHVGGLTQNNFTDNELNHILVFIWALILGMKSHTNKHSGSQAL